MSSRMLGTGALTALLLAACSSGATGPAPGEPTPVKPAAPTWYTVAEDGLAAVRVERQLYERAGDPHFLIRVQVVNRGHQPLGVDLRDYWVVASPNQWGPLPHDHREVVDETRAIPEVLDAARRDDLRRAFAAGALTIVPPEGAAEYYREFNASGRADVDKQAVDPFLFVSIAGQIMVSDGTRAADLEPGSPGSSDLVLAAPVPWGQVPAVAVVIDESRKHAVARSAAGQAIVDLAKTSAGLTPGDDRQCAATPDHPHFWSYTPQQAVPAVVDQLKALCIAIGPHTAMNIARWCCPPALP